MLAVSLEMDGWMCMFVCMCVTTSEQRDELFTHQTAASYLIHSLWYTALSGVPAIWACGHITPSHTATTVNIRSYG